MEQGKKRGSAASLEQLDARIAVGFTRHHKTKKLRRLIGYEGFFYLVDLILYARQNKPDGVLGDMTAEDIEIAVDWHGTPGAFVAALLEVGFLDLDEPSGEYRMHDWEDHQPWAINTDKRRDSARLAGLISQHGEDEGRRLFHVDQTSRSKRRAGRSTDAPDSGSGSLDFGNDSSTTRSTPSLTLSQAKPIHTLADAVDVPLPDWVDRDALEGFVVMRSSIKSPLTGRSLKRALARLDDLRQEGNDPTKVLNQSEDKRWQDLYPLKDDRRGQTNGNGNAHAGKALEAWSEVRAAVKAGKRPDAWKDPATDRALEPMGGFSALRDMGADDAPHRQRDFVAAYNATTGH